MNILVIGGSGLLGSQTVREALSRGHTVSVLSRGNFALQENPKGTIRHVHGDLHTMKQRNLVEVMTGHDAVVVALGIDDREPHRRPAYAEFHMDHVVVCMNVVHAAKESGVGKFVVFGSYFTWFDKRHPELGLARRNVYIRTRSEQRDAVLGASLPGFDAYVLELPYILSSLPGRVPPWTILFSMLATKGRSVFFFKKGGTAAVTARQVGQAALGAIEGTAASGAYPLGGCNLKWTDFAESFFRVAGEEKKLKSLPKWLFKAFGVVDSATLALRNKQRGLSLAHFAEFQYMDAFVNPEIAMVALGYPHEDYRVALDAVISEWLHIHKSNRR
jgi:nucleoside-diphosphate-sugar epimerase